MTATVSAPPGALITPALFSQPHTRPPGEEGGRHRWTMRLHRCIILSMRTTVTIDDDVYEAAQAYAQATGRRLGSVLSEMARQALQPSTKRPKRTAKKTSRFPVFEVPADARMIPASRIQETLAEDGII
jgi:hypothetical protein